MVEKAEILTSGNLSTGEMPSFPPPCTTNHRVIFLGFRESSSLKDDNPSVFLIWWGECGIDEQKGRGERDDIYTGKLFPSSWPSRGLIRPHLMSTEPRNSARTASKSSSTDPRDNYEMDLCFANRELGILLS